MDLNHVEIYKQNDEPWKVTLVDTGEATLAVGHLVRVREYLTDTFCFPYADGVAVLDIVGLGLDGHQVHHFQEKPDGDGGWINDES